MHGDEGDWLMYQEKAISLSVTLEPAAIRLCHIRSRLACITASWNSSKKVQIFVSNDDNFLRVIRLALGSLAYLLRLQQRLLVRLVLLQLGVVAAVELVLLFKFLIERVPIVSNEIRIQIVPLVDGDDDKVAVTLVGNVNRHELVSKLIIEVVDGRRWRISGRGELRRFVVGVEDVDGVFTRSRRLRQVVAAKERKIREFATIKSWWKHLHVRSRICDVIRRVFPDRCGLSVRQAGSSCCGRRCGHDGKSSRSPVDFYRWHVWVQNGAYQKLIMSVLKKWRLRL